MVDIPFGWGGGELDGYRGEKKEKRGRREEEREEGRGKGYVSEDGRRGREEKMLVRRGYR